jgi:biopolymer transport protein ExbD
MLTPRQRRSEHKKRHGEMVDMNLVSLIDVFTILIFFLLSSATGVEILTAPKSVNLPVAASEELPKPTLVLVVTAEDILVDGRRVMATRDALADTSADPVLAPLKAALDVQAQRVAVAAAVPASGAAGAGPAAQAITIMGDRSIPWALLKRVMASCAAANYADVSLAMVKKDSV